MIVEGSSASIVGNKIYKNKKANIALGGAASGRSVIKYNLIEESNAEGIFVVEGEEGLDIDSNWIQKNSDGIVMVNSKGLIARNTISNNKKNGVVAAVSTNARLFNNTIEGDLDLNDEEEASTVGVLIKDVSEPELTKNTIRNNLVEVEIEKKKQRGKRQRKIALDNEV